MGIVGFTFTKINIEKKQNIQGKVNINNNIAIKDVEKRNISLGSDKQEVLKFSFEFLSVYEDANKKLATITLNGDILYLAPAETVEDTIGKWKKDKTIDKSLLSIILNNALTKSNIQALALSNEMQLPPPVPMPKINIQNKQNYIG